MDVGFSQAYITSTDGPVKIRLALPRHIKVKAGQFVGLWIPKASFGSFSQIHPYTVVSWSQGNQKYIDLLVKPCDGIARKLYELGAANKELRNEDDAMDFVATRSLEPRLALITGPHGLSISLDGYETVVMVASGYGIASAMS
ncbi:hypothetical protein HBI23_250360 [Parastagonospora nodorum]|nr:hypothetical protein HBI23_250360 [Parastagonospora nodorum]KAH5621391.1 hypothetical protein HBI51_249980 [Parastagonospora nodorum]KAH5983385.1 hypothetical protein HBI84_248000 [Parastagonospora nodorum]KAH6133506.1 hypothetical protein HBI68_253460 [Parastagonospora nodorum]KAH6380552.1 hypothetical protein HBI08_235840 [Parastagonospora nodorum]